MLCVCGYFLNYFSIICLFLCIELHVFSVAHTTPCDGTMNQGWQWSPPCTLGWVFMLKSFWSQITATSNTNVGGKIYVFIYQLEPSVNIAFRQFSSFSLYFSLHNFLTTRQQASSQFFVHLLLLAFRYTHCLHTAWCKLQPPEDPQSISKHPRSSLYTQAPVPHFHPGVLDS